MSIVCLACKCKKGGIGRNENAPRIVEEMLHFEIRISVDLSVYNLCNAAGRVHDAKVNEHASLFGALLKELHLLIRMALSRKKKTYTPKEARELIGRFCAYRERCQSEVIQRLYDYGLQKGDVEGITADLILGGYLNEERFARAFVRGKYLHNHWGRNKIVRHLKSKRVSEPCIRLGLQEIDDDHYLNKLNDLLEAYDSKLKESNVYVRKRKIADHLIRKGFESNLVWDRLRE